MNAGTAAKPTGLPLRMIRHYENIGLPTATATVQATTFTGAASSNGCGVSDLGSCSRFTRTAIVPADVDAPATGKLGKSERKIVQLTRF